MIESNCKTRILLITLVGHNYNYNLGAYLQAYALQEFLIRSSSVVEILNYRPQSIKERFNNYSGIKSFFNVFLKKPSKLLIAFNRLIGLLRECLKKMCVRKLVERRNRSFESFINNYLKFTNKSYIGEQGLLEDSNNFCNQYDIFLVGSDQVWNCSFFSKESLEVYLISFIKGVYKVSFASSLIATIPSELACLYKDSLLDFRFVSVRENESACQLESILGYKPKLCIDPSFLLDSGQWDRVILKPKIRVQKPYILIYDLVRTIEILDVIEKFSKQSGIIYGNFNPHLFFRMFRYPHLKFCFYGEGPSEFLWLIKEAEFVITSSFHGVVFSIIFQKPFYAILRNDKLGESQNNRIIYLLDELGLKDRYLFEPKEIDLRGLNKDIDWDSVYIKLGKMRIGSEEWLTNCIELYVKEKDNEQYK